MPRLAAITYDGLPISSGGAHKLRSRGFVETAGLLTNFVSAVCVNATPTNLTLELVNGGEINESEFSLLYREFCRQYGPCKFTRGLGEYAGHQWSLDSNTLNETASQLELLRPIYLAGYAGWQIVLHATWNLTFCDDDTKLPLPYQTRSDYHEFEIGWQVFLGESGLYARISERSTAAIFLSLPFEEVSAECRGLVGRIVNAFPVRLSAKHWKRYSLSKKGTSYVGRKLEEGDTPLS